MSAVTGPARPEFPLYDPALAEGIVAAPGFDDGLPGYLGIRTTDVGPGTMTAELDVRAELLNPFGTMHGGVISALVDHILGACLYPVIERGAWAATTQLNLNFTAPVRDGRLSARAEIVAMSKRTAVVRIDVTNDGRLVGAAQGTVTISPPRG